MLSSYGNTAAQTPMNTVIIPVAVGDGCDRGCIHASFAFFSLSPSLFQSQLARWAASLSGAAGTHV